MDRVAPTYAWVIEHREGVIVVDTGQGAHLLETGRSLQPYVRWEVKFRIDPEEEIGPQLRGLGLPAGANLTPDIPVRMNGEVKAKNT
jgi:hypothetical protein